MDITLFYRLWCHDVCSVELFLPVFCLAYGINVVQDCCSPVSSWVLFGKILPLLPHRWTGFPLYSSVCAKHWHFAELSCWSSTYKHPTVRKWIDLTCFHASTNTNPSLMYLFFYQILLSFRLYCILLIFVLQLLQINTACPISQPMEKVGVIYFWQLA